MDSSARALTELLVNSVKSIPMTVTRALVTMVANALIKLVDLNADVNLDLLELDAKVM